MEAADITELIRLHGKAVYGFCGRLAYNQADIEDLYQETFLKALELRHKIDRKNNPKAFLISITLGLWKNNRRKYAIRQRIAPVETFDEAIGQEYILDKKESPEDALISKEISERIQEAAEGLQDKLRIPLYMYYTAEMSNEEIASALKIPKGTVKSRLHKARKILKDVLEDYVYEES